MPEKSGMERAAVSAARGASERSTAASAAARITSNDAYGFNVRPPSPLELTLTGLPSEVGQSRNAENARQVFDEIHPVFRRDCLAVS
jgi:hypothetical protein